MRTLRHQFSDDKFRMVEFIRWTWNREQAREAKRKENPKDDFRIGWGYQFGSRLVTDFRLSKARSKKAR